MGIWSLELLRTVESIWLIWAASTVTLALGASFTVHELRSQRHRCELGSGNTIGFVAVIPIVLMVICTFLETSFMLSAKLGTAYAAIACEQSYRVWEAEGLELATVKLQQSAAFNMSPFASGSVSHRPRVVPDEAAADARAYSEVIGRSLEGAVASDYLERKYTYARLRTRVTLSNPPAQPGPRRRRLTVGYAYPFTFAFLGRILGSATASGSPGYARLIETSRTFTTQETLPHGLGLDAHPAL